MTENQRDVQVQAALDRALEEWVTSCALMMDLSPESADRVLLGQEVQWLRSQLAASAPTLTGALLDAYEQRKRNHSRWGEMSIENRPSDYSGWLPTLGEEFGEVCRALTLEDGDPVRLRAELVDVLAVAWMWLDSIDGDK